MKLAAQKKSFWKSKTICNGKVHILWTKDKKAGEDLFKGIKRLTTNK